MEEIELFIRNEKEDGVFAVSLVENPAIEENWVALSTQGIELKVADEERRVVVGMALVPDKRIYRKMKDKEFNIYFSKETIAKAQELYMRNLNANNVTTEHEKPIKGATVIESWIVENEKFDKSNIYKLNAPVGAWVIMMKINNEEEWKSIKEGTYKGFSIEGAFQGFEELEASKQIAEDEVLVEKIKSIITDIELKSETVELGLVTDLSKSLSEYNKANKTLDTVIYNFYNAIFKARALGEKIKDADFLAKIKNAQKLLIDTDKLSKSLGINPNSIKEYKELKARINTSSDLKDEIKASKSQLKKLTV
tara:strand:- start:104 stop:1030 length:927 start_codon:yes stop_codon:yes gene_type:complete